MTANESETSAVQTTASDGAEELWLTYLNYDQSIGQAVRRLGALSPQNVDIFRSLLLKSRDRSKVKDYEAESIRRLQGEAFVGDEELQRTLIVLTAEDPRYGEELKRMVAATGKPAQLDQVVAAIRSGKPIPVKQAEAPAAPAKEQLKEVPKAPEPAKEAVKEPAKEPVKEPTGESAKKDATKEAVVVPLRKETPRPVLGEAVRREIQQSPQENVEKEKRNLKPVAVIAAVLVVAVVGLVMVVPGLIGGKKAPESQVAAAPAAAQPPAATPAPAAQQAAAPAVDLAMPVQADKGTSSSPPLRAASAQPDAPASEAAPAQSDTRPTPVAGSRYKVIRGDMLSDIAFQVYRDASKFRLIQAANPGIRNKDRILVDQVIFIPPDSGPASR